MSKYREKVGMTWKGNSYKLVTIALSDIGIIVSDVITPSHNTYPKDGKLHTTEDPSSRKMWGVDLPPINDLVRALQEPCAL